ncbi:hypothetical protein Tco_0532674 [Tanacetum coccineum]
MAASAIIISSDSSDESVGSPPSWVILFGDIPTVIPSTYVVAPETFTIAYVISSAAPIVETTLVASPTGLYVLVPYTGFDSDSPDEMSSLEHISPLPAISPFLCTDSSEAPDSSDGPPSQNPYVATIAHWRSRKVERVPTSSYRALLMQSRAMKLYSDKLRHDQKCKKMKLSQDMQLIQKLRHDQKRMKKVFEVMSGRNIVTNSRVTPSWREIVSLTFSEAGVLHVNWTSFGHCVSRRGRPYRTHLNRLSKLLTARKRVGPLPARRLASRHAPPRCSDRHSSASSSSSDPSPVHSLGLDASDQVHSRSLTRDVSPRLCYPPRRALRRSEAFRHWCATSLSTLCPPTTSESSSGDTSERPMHLSSHSAGPSRKRCRSPVDSVPLSTPVTGSLAPTRADLLPPRKRFRDSYSSEASIEEDAEVGPTETGVDMELGIGDGNDVRDHVEIDLRDVRDDTEEYEADASTGDTAEVGIVPTTAPLVDEEIVRPAGEDSSDLSDTRDGIVRSVEDMPVDLDDAVRDFYHYMFEVRIDRIVEIETAQRRLEADQLIASRDRARIAEMIYNLRLENLKVRTMLDIERDRMSSLRLHMSLSQEEFRQIRRDRDDA